MANPKTITQLTERSGALQATDEMEVQVSGETTTKKKALSAVKTFVLGGATIGGTSAGDVITINGTQTLTGKTMTSPRINTPGINSATACTATSAQINTLLNNTYNVKNYFDGLISDIDAIETILGTVTAAQIAHLNGLTVNVQTALNAVAASVPSTTTLVHNYSLQFTLGVGITSKRILQSSILTALGLSTTFYVINQESLNVTLTQVSSDGNKYTGVAYGNGTVDMKITKQTITGQAQLDEIQFSGLTAENSYCVSITLKVLAKTGV